LQVVAGAIRTANRHRAPNPVQQLLDGDSTVLSVLGVFARRIEQQGRSRRCLPASPTGRASIDADLDLPLSTGFVTADDLLPEQDERGS
jgi:hypothetical protein